MKVPKAIRLSLRVLISGFLIWLVYRRTPVDRIGKTLVHVNLVYLCLVFVLFYVNNFMSSLKWRILLQADGVTLPLRRLFATYLVGSFFNIFLPSNIGGDAYRIYDVARLSRNAGGTLASVFADRLSGFLALILLAMAASTMVVGRTENLWVGVLPPAVFLLVCLVIWALYRGTPVQWLLSVTRLDRIQKVRGTAEGFLRAFAAYGHRPSTAAKIMAISVCFQLSVIVCVFLMALSLGAKTDFVYFLAFVPLITLMEAVPISIYGIGVRDAGYVFFFAMAGLTDTQTRSLALLYLAMTVLYSLTGGVLLACQTGAPAPDPPEPSSGA